jgi:hypothetical protein
VMGGRATELVRLVQAPPASRTRGGEMHAMPEMTPDSSGMAHDMEQRGQPMKGMAHDSMSPSHKPDATGAPMAAHMSAMMKLHARMMTDRVIRQRVMADSVMRRLMTQMMDSAGAAQRERMGGAAENPGAHKPPGAKKHEPPAPAPRPATPDSADMPPHDHHSARAAAP